MKCRYIIGKGTDNEIVLEGREALLRHLNQTEGLDAAVSRYMTEVGKEDVGAVQEWVKKGIVSEATLSEQAEVAAQQEYDRSDAEIEKRMSEIEASTNESDKKEFSELEKEMEKRERDSVFSIPLQDVASAVDSLMTKEKEQPNGFGSFIEKKDAQETKAVAQKYSNPESITDEELKKDFTEALMGNPSTSYSDGLLLRESLKEATKRGINTSEMFSGVENEFVKDGFTQEDAKSVVAERLRSIAPQSKQTALPEAIPQVVEAAVAEDTTPIAAPKEKAQSFRERAKKLRESAPAPAPKKPKVQPPKNKKEADDRTNILIGKKAKYNSLSKRNRPKGANLLSEINEEAKALGYTVYTTPTGTIDIFDKKSAKKVTKRGVDRAQNKEANEQRRKAISWASEGSGGRILAILGYFINGGKVNSASAELGENSSEEKAAIKAGLVSKGGVAGQIDTSVIEALENQGVYIAEQDQGEVIAEIQDVLRRYESKRQMIDDIEAAYEDAMIDQDKFEKEENEFRSMQEAKAAAERHLEYVESLDVLDDQQKQQIINDYENYEREVYGRDADGQGQGAADGNSQKPTTKKEIDAKTAEVKALKAEYESAKANHDKKKEAFDRNAQQNQKDMYGNAPQEGALFKNDLKEQKAMLDAAYSKMNEAKRKYNKARDEASVMLEGQISLSFSDELRAAAAELRAASGGGLSILPNALATAYEVFADILDTAKSVSEAVKKWRQTQEYKNLSNEEVKIAEQAIVEEFGQVGDDATVAEPTEVFTEIDAIIDLKGPDAVAARKDFKEKHGAEVYDKARRITREFDTIVNKLESEGKLKKVCP